MKKFMLAGLVITALLLSLAGPVAAASPPDNPGKAPPDFDKVVFVHYPKGEAPGKPPGTPGRGSEEGDYVYDGYHWADTSFSVHYLVNLTGSGDPGTFLDGIQAAFQTWEDEPNSYMDFECDGVDSTAVISSLDDYRDGLNVVGWVNISDDYPNAIAVTIFWYNVLTKEVAEVDVAMNSDPYFVWWQNSADDEVWDFADTLDKFDVDVENLMTHESGHWLVLGDLYADYNSEKTMYGYAAELELTKRSLDAGDEAGIQAIYPITEEAPTEGAMHIADVTMSLGTKTAGPNTFYWAIATVTVIDADGMPVEGATVEGHWEGATTDTDAELTGADGTALLTSNSLRNPASGTTFHFYIDNIEKDGWTYDSGANIESDGWIPVP